MHHETSNMSLGLLNTVVLSAFFMQCGVRNNGIIMETRQTMYVQGGSNMTGTICV